MNGASSLLPAAGNFYALQPLYPGAVPSVINVAATTTEGHKLPVSNYGAFVDISAPGDSLLTYDPYARQANAHLSATSAATPVIGAIVTALRALASRTQYRRYRKTFEEYGDADRRAESALCRRPWRRIGERRGHCGIV